MNLRECLCAVILPLLAPAAVAAPAAAGDSNLISIGSGVRWVQAPAEYDFGWSATGLIDEAPGSGWCAPKGDQAPQVAVFELPGPSRIVAVGFDTASVDTPGSAVKHARFEIADAAAGPWRALGDFTLADATDGQRFAVTPAVGRYLRLTLLDNFGHPEFREMMGVAAFGQPIAAAPKVPVGGTYETDYGLFHIALDGTTAEGCYEHDEGLIEGGGIEGRVLRFTWHEDGGPDDKGPALFAFSDDGASFKGYWWGNGGSGAPAGIWNGKRKSTSVGTCPHWSPKTNNVSRQLASGGRARLYGILFDTDSDRIRPDSRAALEALAAAAKEQPAWKLDIEGHTDSTGDAAHNATLSQKRADAIKAWLVGAGIEASRLTTAGKGATVPIADNATVAGRAQNRRVEVVRR